MSTALMRAMTLLAMAGAVVGSGGCIVGPDYVRPSADVPATYKGAKEGEGARTPSTLPRGRWWDIYGDPVLDALVSQVSLSNQSLRAAEARVRRAQALVDIARAPTLVGLDIAGSNHKIGLTAGWEVDLWGRIRRGVEASEAAAESSADDLAAATLSLQAQVAQNYFLLRVQDAHLRLLSTSVEQYERSLKLTQNQYAVRIVSLAAVVQAEAQLNSTRAQAHEAELARAQLENAIAILIGKAPADFSIASSDVDLQVPAVPATLPSELLVRRPDIAAAERRMAVANAEIGVAEAAFYPSLRLFAGGGIDIAFRGGLALAQYVLDGGLRAAQKAQATAAYDESVASYRQTVLSALLEVEDNLAALRIFEKEAVAQGAAVAAARRSVAIIDNQYRAGIVNYLSVVVVQSGALANERADLALLGRRLVANVSLVKALGGGWEPATKAGAP